MHVTVISGSERRRRWSAAEREEIVLASLALGAVIAEIARQFDVSTSLIYKWRRDAQQPGAVFVPPSWRRTKVLWCRTCSGMDVQIVQ